MRPTKVNIIGDSYINGLRLLQSTCLRNIERTDVHYSAIIGVGVSEICHRLHKFNAYNPDIVILFVGGNDLTRESVDVLQVARDVLSTASLCIKSGVNRVMVTSLLHRGLSSHIPQIVDVQKFNHDIEVCNREIKRQISADCSGHIYFWRNRPNAICNGRLLCKDGTHLDPNGMQIFSRSIRGAILAALNNKPDARRRSRIPRANKQWNERRQEKHRRRHVEHKRRQRKCHFNDATKKLSIVIYR